jgi:hypothetical protein
LAATGMLSVWIGCARFGALHNGQRELAQHLRCVEHSASFKKINRSATWCPAAPPPVNTISKMSLRMMSTGSYGYNDESAPLQLLFAAVKNYKVVNNMPEKSLVYVPPKFVVPSDCPKWPPSLWGLKLGEKMVQILHNNLYRKYRQKFELVGLTTRSEWVAQQIIDAVRTYRKVHNIADGDPVCIPHSFVVPHDDSEWPRQLWGLKLGWKVQGILLRGTFIKYRAEFDRLGLTGKLGPVDDRAQQLMLAIKTYKLVNCVSDGSPVAIQIKFVVPHDSSDWPQELWGLKLGEKACNILHGYYAEYQDEFDALGLTSKLGPTDLRAQRIIQAVKTYKRLHAIPDGGSVAIPGSFVVPHDSSEWPQELWGMKLGAVTCGILHSGFYEEYRDIFDELGLSAKYPSIEDRVRDILLALKTYKRVHGIPDGSQVMIPVSFVVPHDSPDWPQELWGLKLGSRTNCILHHGDYAQYRGEFDALGLTIKLGPIDDRAQRIMLALKTFKSVNNIPENSSLAVPTNFVVPRDNADWPQELWGMRLGETARSILVEDTYSEYRQEFDRLGLAFKYGTVDDRLRNMILAVKTYKRVHAIPDGGKVVIPIKFVVPTDSNAWPQELWGMKLGCIVGGIFNGGHFRDHRNKLQELGVCPRLGSLEERARKFLLAVETYRKVRRIPQDRQVFVPYYYIVPHGSPDWPQELWDMKLGIKVSYYVNRNSYPDYTEQFRAMGLYRKWE